MATVSASECSLSESPKCSLSTHFTVAYRGCAVVPLTVTQWTSTALCHTAHHTALCHTAHHTSLCHTAHTHTSLLHTTHITVIHTPHLCHTLITHTSPVFTAVCLKYTISLNIDVWCGRGAHAAALDQTGIGIRLFLRSM